MLIDLAQLSRPTLGRWCRSLLLALALTLTACVGGGGEDSGSAPAPVASGPATISSLSRTVRKTDGSEIANANPTVGDSVIFRVSASGSEPLRYQWYRNGVAIDGATGASFSIAQLSSDDDGAMFSVRVSNAENSAGTLSAPQRLAAYPRSGSYLLAGWRRADDHADGLGTSAGFVNPQGVTIDPDGNLYVVDRCTIRKVTPAGIVSTWAGNPLICENIDGSLASASFVLSNSDITRDAAGNFYLTNVNAGEGNVRRISATGTVSTLQLPWQAFISSSAGGLAARPVGITHDNDGNLYLTDMGNATIRKLNLDGSHSIVAGQPFQNGNADGVGANARIGYAPSITRDAAGNLYVTDSVDVGKDFTSTIRKITPSGMVSTLAGGTTGASDGVGSAAKFNGASGIARDSAGNLYVADAGNHTIRKISPDGTVSTLAGLAGQPGDQDASGAAARFYNPTDLAIDASGNLYVSDSGNLKIRKITPAGAVTTLAGKTGISGRNAGSDANGQTVKAFAPGSMYTDSNGNIFTVDTHNHTVHKITPSGVISTLAGKAGEAGSIDGPANLARFNGPTGITGDSAGNLYVADITYDTIRKISPAGVVSSLAGNVGQPGYQDGSGTAARFNFPFQLSSDTAGNVYVVEANSHAVRKIMPSGMVSTLAGHPDIAGDQDGEQTKARFATITAITCDSSGNLFVAEKTDVYAAETTRLRRISANGTVSTVFAIRTDRTFMNDGSPMPVIRSLSSDGKGNLYALGRTDAEFETIYKITQTGAISIFRTMDSPLRYSPSPAWPKPIGSSIAYVNRPNGPVLYVSIDRCDPYDAGNPLCENNIQAIVLP